MTLINNIIQAMNNVTLEEEEEWGLAIEESDDSSQEDTQNVCDAKLCLVGRFISEGNVDFQAMQHTLAALWKPKKRVYIKELDAYLFPILS